MALTVGTVSILDGTGTAKQFRAGFNPDGSVVFFHEIEQGGSPLSNVNPLPVIQGGGLGSDSSSNSAALPPAIGSTIGGSLYGGSGPFASYVLVGSCNANPARACIRIENVSGEQIVVVRDDGTAAAGAALSNASWWILAGGGSAYSQGGSDESHTFKGRVQLWAATDPGVNARPTIMQD